MKKISVVVLISLLIFSVLKCGSDDSASVEKGESDQIKPDISTPQLKGKYLATIGVCNACHTPQKTGSTFNGQTIEDSISTEIHGRTNPDWVSDLDSTKEMAGGVPFWMRFDANTHGVVYAKNITPDVETGIGSWTDNEIYSVLKTGKRRDGTSLFLFPPHSFFKNLADEDVYALISYLKTLKPIKNLVPASDLPFPTAPDSLKIVASPAPGISIERGEYLTTAIVGCAECHSHTDKNGVFQKFAGGSPDDPFLGVFKLGPDLPLRSSEKGFSAFPYPGYALFYTGNLTRFGAGGDRASVTDKEIVNAVRKGILIDKDNYGRPVPMGHIMMWQYYQGMSDEDAYSIISYIKSLNYIPNPTIPGLINFGTDWERAFKKMYNQSPSAKDKAFFGK